MPPGIFGKILDQTMAASVDRLDPTPLHYQVRRAILALIDELKLKPGDQLPPESVLWERFQVSRQTLRQAVESLVREHILYRQRPKGTFVGFGAVESDLQSLRSVWEDFRRLGMEPTVRVLSVRETAARQVDPFLNSMNVGRFLELTRVFAANQSPVSYDQAYFPLPEFEWLKQQALDVSWYELLRSRGGATVSHARNVIDATKATKQIAGHLSVPIGTALLRLRRQVYSQDDRPIAFTSALYRCDFFQFSVMLSRR
jgi:GntR family transcriptional regulator